MQFRKQTKYASCQLITAINARIWLGGIDVSEEEFEHLIDLVRCRYGSALKIERAYAYLRLITEEGPSETLDFNWVKDNLPVEIGYDDPKLGFHSALVIGIDEECVLLENASWDKKKWNEIRFYPHLYNRTLKTFKLEENYV